MNRTTRTLTGILAVAILVSAFPFTAMAQTDETPTTRVAQVSEEDATRRLESAKKAVLEAIDKRLNALARLTARVDSAGYVTDEHAATLLDEYAAAEAILRAGIENVTNATGYEELRRTSPAIFEQTLVFALLGPKTHAVIGSDTVVGVAPRFDEYGAKLQGALDHLSDAGADTTAAQADLDEAVRLVSSAVTTAGPVAESVIVLQPGDEIREPLAAAKDNLEESRRRLDDAREMMIDVSEFVLDSIGDGTL
jgi:hypothetical protein